MRYADTFCRYKELFNPHRFAFTGRCVITKQEVTVEVPAKELYAYRQGAHIQDAFTSLSADEREFLMSGISAEGWSQAFPRNKGED